MWSDVIQQVPMESLWWAFARDAVLKITLVLLAGWGLAVWMTRHSAAARHAVWSLTLTATLLVPLAMWLLPGWGIAREVSIATNSEPAARQHSTGLSTPAQTDGASNGRPAGKRRKSALSSTPFGPRDSQTADSTSRERPAERPSLERSSMEDPDFGKGDSVENKRVELASASTVSENVQIGPSHIGQAKRTSSWVWWWIGAVWGSGFAVVLFPFIVGLCRVMRLCRRSERLQDSRWLRMLGELTQAIGLKRSVRLLKSHSRLGPSAGGVFRPFVMIPPDSDDWQRERMRLVLLHELAHIKRGDVMMQWITWIVCAVYWFHPLVWLAARRMRIERERACDDLVLAGGMPPADYAEALVEIAERYRSPRWVSIPALAMARMSQLEDRVRCLLDTARPRFRLSSRALLGLAAGSLLLATTIATAGKVVVRDRTGAKVGEIVIPKGGTVSLVETNTAKSTAESTPSQKADLIPKNDWPMWGGTSHRNNVSGAKRLPVTWDTKQRQNIRWTSQLGSVTFGGTVVAGDRVFVGTNNNAGLVERFPKKVDLACLVCLDRKTGQFLWQHSNRKLPSGRVHDWPLQGILSTPCVVGDRLWYVTNRCEVVCLDVDGFHDGKNDGPFVDEESISKTEADVVWKLDMMSKLGVSPHNVSVCSPVTDGKRLFVITGNGTDETHVNPPPAKAPDVICLDRETGKILWQDRPAGQRTLHGSWSSPTFGVIQGQPMVLMGLGDGWVYAYDPAGDGQGNAKLLWKFDCNPKDALWALGGRGTRNPYVATPVIWNDKVYLRTGQDPEHGEGNADLWCIDPVKHLDGSDVSATRVFQTNVAGKPLGEPLPPRRKQNLDKSDGEVELSNPKSAVVWHFQKQDVNRDGQIEFDETMHRGLGSPAIANGMLFVSDFSGLFFCLDANTGRCHWTHDLFAACYGSPLIADGKVYVGDEDGEMAVFKLSNEKTLLSETFHETSTYCTPVACGETLYVLDKSKLHAIGLSPREADATAVGNPSTPAKKIDSAIAKPKRAEDEGIAWGEPVKGLRLGIRSALFAKHATKFRYGDWIRYELWIKNETTESIRIPRDPRDYYSSKVKDGQINLTGSSGFASFDLPIGELEKAALLLPAGKSAPLLLGGSVQAPVHPPNTEPGRYGPAPLALPVGKHKLFAERSVFYGKSAWLKSATVEIEILPAARLQIVPVNELGGNRTRKSIKQDKGQRILEFAEPDAGHKTELVLSIHSEVILDNHDVVSSMVKNLAGGDEDFRVDITLTLEAAKRIARSTKSLTTQPNPTRRLGILLDGKVLAAPRLFSSIEGAKIAITGDFTKAHASSLVEALNMGKN